MNNQAPLIRGDILRSPAALNRYREQFGTCYLCLKPLDQTMNIDHIIPKAVGGPNHWGNKALTHEWCNSFKANQVPPMDLIETIVVVTGCGWLMTKKAQKILRQAHRCSKV